MPFEPGRVVGQNVRLIRQIGRGGMASVWVADHLTLHTQVAVKFIDSEIAKHEGAVARFSQEATAAARIKSPHVVQIFDHGVTADGQPYIVMELLEGEDLAERIDRLGVLPVREVVAVVEQVCRALARAHRLGIVHRDIKPENIYLFDSDGDLFVKVLDFGIAKHVSPETPIGMTTTGVMVGTPCYMSPEQVLSAKDVDFSCDLWAVAVVAYQALTGRLPFAGETVGAISVAIDKAVYELPSSLRAELVASFDSWFARAFARDKSQRFGSPRQMAEEFRLAAGAGVSFDAPATLHPLADLRFEESRAAEFPSASGVSDSNAPHVVSRRERHHVPRSRSTRALWALSGTLAVGIVGAVIAAIVLTSSPDALRPAPRVVAVPAVAPRTVQALPKAAAAPASLLVEPAAPATTANVPAEPTHAEPARRPRTGQRATAPRPSQPARPGGKQARPAGKPERTAKDRGF